MSALENIEYIYPQAGENNVLTLYKYVTSHALKEILKHGDLKITYRSDANDPYEMLSAGVLPNEPKEPSNIGFISFSEKHDIASLWGNYAEKFMGACLRFDIPFFESNDNYDSIESGLQRTSEFMKKAFGINIFYIRRGIDNGANVIQLHNGDVIVKCRYSEYRFCDEKEIGSISI